MSSGAGAINRAWILLLVVSIASVGTAELVGNRIFAVMGIMSIAALKGAVIVTRFMDVNGARRGVRLYMALWIALTAVGITALFCFSRH
jgi:hypothetical protein